MTTLADNVDENNGEIVVTLHLDSQVSPNYFINPQYGFANTRVIDDDQPEISIIAGDSIIEGDTAEFRITSTIPREIRLPINYSVSNDDGNFLSEIQLSVGEIFIEAWETEAVINVSTIQDES